MAKKRSQPRTRKTHHDTAEHAPGVNGFDLDDAHDPHADLAVPAGVAEDAVVTAGGFLSRMIYTASYSVSYGVVFPAMFLAYSVPRDNALVRGLLDGGRAASDAIAALYDESQHPEPAHAEEHATA